MSTKKGRYWLCGVGECLIKETVLFADPIPADWRQIVTDHMITHTFKMDKMVIEMIENPPQILLLSEASEDPNEDGKTS